MIESFQSRIVNDLILDEKLECVERCQVENSISGGVMGY